MLPFVMLTGALGFVLRTWLVATGVDHKGLLVDGHIAGTLSLILTGITLGLLFLWLRQPLKKCSQKNRFPASLPAAIGCWVAAAGVLFTELPQLQDGADRMALVSVAIATIAAIALGILGFFRLKGLPAKSVFHSVVTVYFLFRSVSMYRVWSAETQLHMYFFQLLASVFLLLTTYHRTALAEGAGQVNNWLFFQLGSVFFCLAAICGDQPLFYLSMAIWMLTVDCDVQPRYQLPQAVSYCLDKLEKVGFESYVVGGCVRDMLLGLTPHDYDICTAAKPEETAEIFRDHQLVRSGEKHGTIGVVIDHEVYEITTFRTEGGYSDSRHPDWVEFVPHVEEDLARRDFTVNAMAYHPKRGLIDPHGGEKDLEAKVLRAVGDPTRRFSEDALRILRGVRFASRFRLTPHPDTENAMAQLAPTMENLAAERVFSELCKLILTVDAQELLRYRAVITQVIPALQATVDFRQHTPHHAYDVYTHTAYVVENTPKELPLRLAALLHDVGKPATFTQDENGIGHFYEHAAVSADMADSILAELKAPTALRQQVVLLIRQHMSLLTPEEKLLRRRLAQYGEETLRQMIALQKADRIGTGVSKEDEDSDAALALLEEILAQESCFSLKDLAIGGSDLMGAGFTPGPAIGKTLNALLELVIDQQLPNEKSALLEKAKALKEETE